MTFQDAIRCIEQVGLFLRSESCVFSKLLELHQSINWWSGPRAVSEDLCLTLLTRMLTLLPLALHLTDAMPPRPGNSSKKFLLLQCTFASLWKGININHLMASNWQYGSAKTFFKLWVGLLKPNYFYLMTPLPQTPASSPEDYWDLPFFQEEVNDTLFPQWISKNKLQCSYRIPKTGLYSKNIPT